MTDLERHIVAGIFTSLVFTSFILIAVAWLYKAKGKPQEKTAEENFEESKKTLDSLKPL